MANIKKNFTGGRMNKDVDERLVPNGEYRDAMNIQVRTTDSGVDGLGDGGTVQNIQGNTSVGSAYISGIAPFVGMTPNCVGSVVDEKSNKSYHFFATKIGYFTLSKTPGSEMIFYDSIIEVESGVGVEDTKVNPVVVDVYAISAPMEDIFGTSNTMPSMPTLSYDTGFIFGEVNVGGTGPKAIEWDLLMNQGSAGIWGFGSSGIDTALGALTVLDGSKYRVGMTIQAYNANLDSSTTDGTPSKKDDLFAFYEEYKPPVIKAIVNNTLILKEPITVEQKEKVKDATHLTFYHPRALKFTHNTAYPDDSSFGEAGLLPIDESTVNSDYDTDLFNTANRHITGINIIGDLLFWTDGHGEPKKINIKRCKAGTDESGIKHTKIHVNSVDGITPLADETKLLNPNSSYAEEPDVLTTQLTGVFNSTALMTNVDWGPNDDLLEEHITVIRPAPTKAPTLVMKDIERKGVTDIDLSGWAFIGLTDPSQDVYTGDVKRIAPTGDSANIFENTKFRKGDILLFKEMQYIAGGFEDVGDPIIVKVNFICYENDDPSSPNFGEEILESSNVIRVKVITRSATPGPSYTNWNISLEPKKSLFENKMVRFAYRYKYEDGEYSAFSPWSELAFLPGRFDYNSKKAYNLGMVNHLKELVIKDFIPYKRPLDVKGIDILYKATNDQNVYIAETIKRGIDDAWTNFTVNHESQDNLENIKTGELAITSEMIHRVLPSTQMLRSWDNVPRNALAQEIIGNRLVYGNYTQGYDIFNFNVLQNVSSRDLEEGEIAKSIKSIRDYRIGVVLGDKYGRETPVLTSNYSLRSGGDDDNESITGDIRIEKTLAQYSNSFSVSLTPKEEEVGFKSGFRDGYVKYYVKETSNEYYNLIMDRWYDSGDGTIWLSFNSADRNKVDEETYLLLKNRHGDNEAVLEKARYKVIAIENEAPDFIKTTINNLGVIDNYNVNASFGSVWEPGATDATIATSAPTGFWSDEQRILIWSNTWNESPIGDINDEGIFGREIKGWLDFRIIGLNTNADAITAAGGVQKLYSDWRKISHYSKGGPTDAPDKVYINWHYKYTAGNNGGANMYERFETLYGAGGAANLQYQLEFREHIPENKPEFDGKFFVKIEKDEVIENHIVNTQAAYYTYTPEYIAQINYIESTVVSKSAIETVANIPTTATFKEAEADSSNWFFGAFRGCVDYQDGSGAFVSEEDDWFESPTINDGNYIEGYTNTGGTQIVQDPLSWQYIQDNWASSSVNEYGNGVNMPMPSYPGFFCVVLNSAYDMSEEEFANSMPEGVYPCNGTATLTYESSYQVDLYAIGEAYVPLRYQMQQPGVEPAEIGPYQSSDNGGPWNTGLSNLGANLQFNYDPELLYEITWANSLTDSVGNLVTANTWSRQSIIPHEGGIFGGTSGYPLFVYGITNVGASTYSQGWQRFNDMTADFWYSYAKDNAGTPFSNGNSAGGNVFIDGARAVEYRSNRFFDGNEENGQYSSDLQIINGINVGRFYKPTSLGVGLTEGGTGSSLGRMNIGVMKANYDGAYVTDNTKRLFDDLTSVGTLFRFSSDPNQDVYKVTWVENNVQGANYTSNHQDVALLAYSSGINADGNVEFMEDGVTVNNYYNQYSVAFGAVPPLTMGIPSTVNNNATGCKPCAMSMTGQDLPDYSAPLNPKYTCQRLNREIEFRKVDINSGSTYAEGFSVEGEGMFDPRSLIKHDGSESTSIEILMKVSNYSETPDPNVELGACWETEPRESVNLDLYHEASSAIPLTLNESNIYNFIPIKSTISITRLTPGGLIDINVSNNGTFVKDIHFLSHTSSTLVDTPLNRKTKGPVVKLIETISTSAGDQEVLYKSVINKGDVITFTHPDGTQTSSKVISYVEPRNFLYGNLIEVKPDNPLVINDETSLGINRHPYPFKVIDSILNVYLNANQFAATSGGAPLLQEIPDYGDVVILASKDDVLSLGLNSAVINSLTQGGNTEEGGFLVNASGVQSQDVMEVIGWSTWQETWGTCGDGLFGSDCVELFTNNLSQLFQAPWGTGGLNNTHNTVTNADGTAVGYSVADMIEMKLDIRTGYYEIEPETWRYPVRLNWSNCFSFGNGVESDRVRDDFNAPQIDNGVKVSTTFSGYGEEKISNGLIYSGLYNSLSEVNDLNEFNMAEKITKSLNPSYGSIQRLKTRDTDVVVFTEDKVLKVLGNKDAVFNADGNPNLTATDRVLGQAIPFVGDYGISKNPESLAWDQFRMYFTDAQRGAVLRLSRDGLTPISNIGMKNWFRENLSRTYTSAPSSNLTSHYGKLIGSFDIVNGEYNLTIKPQGSENPDQTLSFSEASKGWVSFKSFIPESGVSLAGKYYTVKDGHVWEHYIPEYNQGPTYYNDSGDGTCDHYVCVERNRFYDEDEDDITNSSVTVLFNDMPDVVKSFKTIDYEGSESRIKKFTGASEGTVLGGVVLATDINDGEYYNLQDRDGWWINHVETNMQEGEVFEFIEKENKYFNRIGGKFSTQPIDLDTSEFDVQGIGVLSNIQDGIAGTDLENTGPSYPTMDDPDNNPVVGCMDENACNYNASATVECEDCCEPGVAYGCIDPLAANYMPTAEMNCPEPYVEGVSTNPCTGEPCAQCMYDDGDGGFTTTPPNTGDDGIDSGIDDSSGDGITETEEIYGCTDPSASNYNSEATIDDGSCIAVVSGCLNDAMFNYDPNATHDCAGNSAADWGWDAFVPGLTGDESCCESFVFGCMDSTAVNYNPDANTDDGSCQYSYEDGGDVPENGNIVISIGASGDDFWAPMNEANTAGDITWTMTDNQLYDTGVVDQPDWWNEDSIDWLSEDVNGCDQQALGQITDCD